MSSGNFGRPKTARPKSVPVGITLQRTGPVGYTVRGLPRHDLMAAPAELGVVKTA